MRTLIALAFFVALPLYAQTPVAVKLYLKTATYAVTQVTKTADGKSVTTVLSRHASVCLAREALRKLPPGDYVVTTPSYYATVAQCGPVATSPVCADFTDTRIMAFVEPGCSTGRCEPPPEQFAACTQNPLVAGGP